MHLELMFTVLEHMFMRRELMFIALEYNFSRCINSFYILQQFKHIFPNMLDGTYFHVLIDGVGIRDVGAEGEDLHGWITHGEIGGLHTATHSDKPVSATFMQSDVWAGSTA